MVFEQIAKRDLRQMIADQVEDNVLYGVASAGGAATITHLDATHDDAALKDLWGYINNGTSEGDEFQIDGNIASTNVITADRNFSSTPDTTSLLEIHSKFRVARYNRAIDDAIRRFNRDYPVSQVRAEIVTNCALSNPTFRDWANGAASDPDSWTTSSEFVQQAVTNPRLVAGEGKYIYKARVWSNSALVILEVDDGATQDQQAHDGLGFNLLTLEHEPAVGATAVTVKIGHSGASAVSSVARVTTSIRGDYSLEITFADGVVCIVDSVFAPTGYTEYKYSLPSTFRVIVEATHSPAVSGLTNLGVRNGYTPLPRTSFTGGIDGQSPAKYIQFDSNMVSFSDDTYIQVSGMGSAAIPATDDAIIEGPISVFADWASYQLMRPGQDADRFHRDALEALQGLRVAYPSGAYIFDPI